MGLIAALVVAFTFLANLGIFSVLVKNNPKSWTNRLTAFLALIFAAWTVGNFIALSPNPESYRLLWVRIVMAITAPMGVTIYLLAKVFPQEKLTVKNSYVYALGAFVVLVIVLALSPWMFTRVENLPTGSFNLVPGPAIAIFAISHMGFTTWGLIILILKFLKAKGKLRRQFGFFIWGNILTLTLITLTNFVAVVFFQAMQYTFIGPTFTLFLVGFVTYAIIRHRLFDVRSLVVRSIAFSVLVLVVGAIYASISTLIRLYLIPETTFLTSAASSIISVLIITFSFQPLRQAIEKFTDKIFYKGKYDSEKVLSELSHIMASTILLDDLTHGTLQSLIKHLRITRGAFVLLSDGKVSTVKSEGFSSPPEFDENDIKMLGESRDTLIFDELEDPVLKDLFRKTSLFVAVHLRTEGRQIGLLVLGEKESGDIYSRQDLQLLEIFAPEAAVAIQNSESYEEIRRFNITLQEEIDKATADLQAANEKLKILDKAKDEFVSLASHELRTPMTAIKSYVWMVLNDKAGTKVKDYLQLVFNSTERLIHLVNDMLDISRIESGRVQLKLVPFDMPELLKQIVDEFKARAGDKKIKLELNLKEKLPLVTADRDKVMQVLENLVGNSLKFTDTGGKIILTSVVSGNYLQTSVSDTGRGISEEELGKLFTKFERGGSPLTTLSEPGTGLGLYLCKQYIELHKGTVSVKSKLGQGSTFAFTLPLQ